MTEQIYAVGGAIRDALLGLPVKDRDWVVVGSTPERFGAIVKSEMAKWGKLIKDSGIRAD